MRASRSIFPFLSGSRGELAASRAVMIVGLGGIVAVLALSLGITYAVLEIKTGLRAYVSGESQWAKGRDDALYFLGRYIETGRDHYLDLAREGLAIPLGDREARLALEQSPPDVDAARQGFLRGDNHPEDVPYLIWLYQHFRDIADFKDAVAIWEEADQHILRLEEILQLLEAGVDSPRRLEQMDRELDFIRSQLRPLEKAFSRAMGAADRRFNRLLFVTVGIFLSLAALTTMAIFWWAARRLAMSEKESREILEHAGVGMAMIHRSGHIQSANGKLCEILGYPENGLKGASISAITDSCEKVITPSDIVSALEHEKEVTMDRQCVVDNRHAVWLRFTFSAMGHYDGFILVVEDISDERLKMDLLAYEATHDQLTGLLNRREFYRRLKIALETAKTEPARHVVCVIDLDRFKEINDSCGHAAGDDFLVRLGGIIRQPLREGDVLARLGGDEFAVIFSYCPMDVAVKLAEQLRDAVESFCFEWEGLSFQVTLSAGLVELGAQLARVPPEHILEVADSACYWAKQQGRNRVYVVPPDEVL